MSAAFGRLPVKKLNSLNFDYSSVFVSMADESTRSSRIHLRKSTPGPPQDPPDSPTSGSFSVASVLWSRGAASPPESVKSAASSSSTRPAPVPGTGAGRFFDALTDEVRSAGDGVRRRWNAVMDQLDEPPPGAQHHTWESFCDELERRAEAAEWSLQQQAKQLRRAEGGAADATEQIVALTARAQQARPRPHTLTHTHAHAIALTHQRPI